MGEGTNKFEPNCSSLMETTHPKASQSGCLCEFQRQTQIQLKNLQIDFQLNTFQSNTVFFKFHSRVNFIE